MKRVTETVEVEAQGRGQAPLFVERERAALGDEDLVSELLAGRLGGVVVRNTLAAHQARQAVAALRAAPGDSGPVRSPPFPGWTYGAILVVSDPDLESYLARARALEAALEAALATVGQDLAAVVQDTLRALCAGGQVAVPKTNQDQAYAAVTVRALAAGQGVAVHSERSDWPSMAQLAPQLQPDIQLSCYLPLELGEGGGELRVFHVAPDGEKPALGGMDEAAAEQALSAFGVTVVRPEVGDLLLFNGGRFNHRVTPCTRGERWTVGCFAAPAVGGGLLAWS